MLKKYFTYLSTVKFINIVDLDLFYVYLLIETAH